MLTRAYRLTDKLGVMAAKSSAAASDALLSGAQAVMEMARRGAGGAGALLLTALRLVFRLLRRLFDLARFLVGLLLAGMLAVAALAGRLGGRTARSVGAAASGAMARRAARAEMQATIAEDPLRAQNRMLSALTVVLLLALFAALFWATNPGRNDSAPPPPNSIALLSGSATSPVASDGSTPVFLQTAVPTATSLPDILQVRGSLAYVVREGGQTDIWAVNVDSRQPVRLTNDPADERDPAWSPDGRRLAYASRRDGNWDLYIYDLATNSTTRLTYGLEFQGKPTWSPDGVYLAYESYAGDNLDIYILAVDGSQQPLRLTDHAAADFSPAWSPDGRRIAFVSWRDGNQDVYLFSLDDPRDAAVVNLTNTPTRDEEYPAWSPDGDLLTYSALDVGVEKVFVQRADGSTAPAVLERGKMPTWSPDGGGLIYVVDSVDATQLVAAPFAGTGVATLVQPVPPGSTGPVWTATPLPPALVNSGGQPPAVTQPLFIEQETRRTAAPFYRLDLIPGVNAPTPNLSERVNDSFNALRGAVLAASGVDFLGDLDDAFWAIDHPIQPGEPRRNWLMTGRGVALPRSSILGFPTPVELVRYDLGVDTYWRVFVRVADDAQGGLLGEPLRRLPWDFGARQLGDVTAYDAGGRLRQTMPSGYYVDLTLIASDYGWLWLPSGTDWRANVNAINWWMLYKPDGLVWLDAMRELYTDGELGGFVPTPTP